MSGAAAAAQVASAGLVIPATSYANTGGTGSRTGIITVTTDMALDEGAITSVVNGGLGYNATDGCSPTTAAVSGKYIKFDFGTAKRIDECRLSSNVTSNGTWKWQGSNDNSAWTDIGSSFSMVGGNAPAFAVIGDMSANNDSYRYYRTLGVSGNDAGGTYLVEFEFKISA